MAARRKVYGLEAAWSGEAAADTETNDAVQAQSGKKKRKKWQQRKEKQQQARSEKRKAHKAEQQGAKKARRLEDPEEQFEGAIAAWLAKQDGWVDISLIGNACPRPKRLPKKWKLNLFLAKRKKLFELSDDGKQVRLDR